MEIKFTDLTFLMISVKACIGNYDWDSGKVRWDARPPFISIVSDCHTSIVEGIEAPVKKSNRGRKKLIKPPKKKFKSNVIFTLRRLRHRIRPPKDDNLSSIATVCSEHQNCEVIIKLYTIRLFNKGKIVCVGILEEDKSDFIYCMDEVIKYLAEKKIEEYLIYNFPPIIYTSMAEILREKYKIIDMTSTLENYQFSLNYNIDLYKLKDFFIAGSQTLVNIDYAKLYKYLVECCLAEKYTFDIETLTQALDQKNTVRKHIVAKSDLADILSQVNLKIITLAFEDFWGRFCEALNFNNIETVK